MTLAEKQSVSVRFTPHWTASFGLIHMSPIFFAGAYLLSEIPSLKFGVKEMSVVVGALMITAGLVIFSEIKRRQTSIILKDGVIYFKSCGIQKNMRPEKPVCVQMCRAPIQGIFGAIRIRIYSDYSRLPWISFLLAAKQANQMMAYMMCVGEECGEEVPGRVLPGQYSAVIAAVTSEGSVLPILAAVQFSLFACGSTKMNILAIALLLIALMNIVFTVLYCRGLSLTKRKNGFEITSGFFGGKRMFIPSAAVTGLHVHISPAATLCGSGIGELICAGGRRIPCMCSIGHEKMKRTAFRLIGADDKKVTSIVNIDCVSKKHIKLLISAMFIMLPMWFFAWSGDNEAVRFIVCMVGIGVSAAVIHCAAALKCAGDCGLELTPSAIYAGGMGISGAEFVFLKRSDVAGIRMRSTVFEEMNDICSVKILMSGSRSGVWCRCIPYGEVNGLIARFC